jgi:membrane-associated protease RseP (regulator of RpoE activity)
LKLAKDEGLLVEKVQAASPAEKAGLKTHDLLLKANDKPLADIRDLMKLIDEVKEGKLTLKLLRDGKRETVVATLAKRPALSPEARDWLKQFGPAMTDGQPMRFHVIGPGQIVPEGAPGTGAPGSAKTEVEVIVRTKAKLPDGSEIEVTRSGNKPAKVIVTQDKDRWEGTSDDLSRIPDTARREVEKLLKAPTEHILLSASPAGRAQGNVIYFGPAPSAVGTPSANSVGPDMEKRLAEMQRQIDELKAQVKALQGAEPKK